MRERAAETGGTFTIASRPEAGALVTFTVPYIESRAAEHRRWAIVNAAAVAIAVLFAAKTRSPAILLVLLYAVVASVRHTVAYWKTRRTAEAAQ